MCYLRSIHRIIEKSHRLPWRDELLKLSPQTLSIVVLLGFVAIVLLKAYAIGIVWRCYKYLTVRQHNLRTMLPYIIPESSTRQVSGVFFFLFIDIFLSNRFVLKLKQRNYVLKGT